jgi:hypothetical protein
MWFANTLKAHAWKGACHECVENPYAVTRGPSGYVWAAAVSGRGGRGDSQEAG